MLQLRLSQSEKLYDLDIISVEKEGRNNFFLLRASQNSNINVTISYILDVGANSDPSNYECFPFMSTTHYKESNIFEVYVDDISVGRIGWIFPIQALVSTEHDYADDKHFLNYSFASFYKLLRGDYFSTNLIIDSSDFNVEITLDQIYTPELIVLSLSKNKTKLIEDFDISNYLHSLYNYRYFFCENQNQLHILTKIEDYILDFTKLKIKKISSFLQDEIFIKSLFKDYLIKNNHPLIQFHFLYQIIEMLIVKVYDLEVQQIIKTAGMKTKQSYDLLVEMKDIQTEEYRIKKLFTKYISKNISSTKDLVNACNQILKHFGKEKVDFIEAFYQVRNVVVHNFRTITTIDLKYVLLIVVNKCFEKLLVEVLTYYNEPLSEGQEFSHLSLPWLQYLLLNEKLL